MDTLAVRNQNPGNLKDPSTGTFRSFSDPVEGKAALYNDLTAKMTGQSKTGLSGQSSLLDFSRTYAPAGDNNDPDQYAANLANKLGVSPDTPIGQLMPRIDDFASAVASNEDPSTVYRQSSPIQTPQTRKTLAESVRVSEGEQQSVGEKVGKGLLGLVNPLGAGKKIGEGLGTLIARAKTKKGQDIATADYDMLTPEAKARLQAKGVPITRGAQLAESADKIKGPSAGQIVGDVAKAGLTIASAVGTGKAVQAARQGIRGLVNGTSALESKAVLDNLKRIGLKNPSADFKAFNNAEKAEMLAQALKGAGKVDGIVIQQALNKIMPLAIKEAGGKVAFSSLYPNAGKVLGLAGKYVLPAIGVHQGSRIIDRLIDN